MNITYVVVSGFMLHNKSEESAQFATELARQTGCSTVMLCPAGHGADLCPVHSFESAVLALVEDINEQATGSVYLIGFSLGGTMAVEAARRLGTRCLGVATISSFASLPTHLRIGCALGQLLAQKWAAKIPAIVARFAAVFGTPRWVCQEFRSTRPSAVADWMKAMPMIAVEAVPLGCPSTHIGCQFDMVIPTCYSKQLAEITGGRYVRLNRATHATIPGATVADVVGTLLRLIK